MMVAGSTSISLSLSPFLPVLCVSLWCQHGRTTAIQHFGWQEVLSPAAAATWQVRMAYHVTAYAARPIVCSAC